MGEQIPIFHEHEFSFREDEEPDHQEGDPSQVVAPECYSAYSLTQTGKLRTIAGRIPDEDMATMIGYARVRREAKLSSDHACHEDIIIFDPDSGPAVLFKGRTR